MAPVVELFHVPKFRSTRVLWLYYELEAIYHISRSDFPKLKLHKLSPDTFRTDKPKELLAANPNGKVPAFIDGDATMFEGCAILHYILDHYDFDSALGDKRDKVFSAALYKLSFYAAGTVDNLFATSSPIQAVQPTQRPGDEPNAIELNRKAFKEVVGPVLVDHLGERRFMFGNSFTAIDVVVGYVLARGLEKRPQFFEDFPTLSKYAQAMAARVAYQKAIVE